MTLFDIGSEMESIMVTMSLADDLLDIFKEDAERDLERLDDGDCWVQYMRKRFALMKSMLEVAAMQQGEAITALTSLIDTVYAMGREEEATQKQT